MSWFYQSIQEKVAGSQLFMQLKAARPKIYQAVMCIWHGKNLCKKFGWSSDQERNEDENCKQEADKGQEKSISEENVQVKNRSPEDEAKPSEDIENQSIEVNMTTTSSKKEEDENFQVLTK